MSAAITSSPKFSNDYTAYLACLYRSGRAFHRREKELWFSQKFAEYLLRPDVVDWDAKMNELATLCRQGVDKKDLHCRIYSFNSVKPTTDTSQEAWAAANLASSLYNYSCEGHSMSLFTITKKTDFIWRLSGLLGDRFLVSVVPSDEGPIVWRNRDGIELGDYSYHILLRFYPDGLPAVLQSRVVITLGRPLPSAPLPPAASAHHCCGARAYLSEVD